MIEYSKHARTAMVERNIRSEGVERALARPELTRIDAMQGGCVWYMKIQAGETA